MEILPSILSWIDNTVRVAKQNVSDLVNDTGNALEKTAANTADTINETLGTSKTDIQKFQDEFQQAKEYGKDMPRLSVNPDIDQFLGAGTFIGPSARAWDAAMHRTATEMKVAGKSSEDIWRKTGTWLDTPDKVPLQEISDHAAQIVGNGEKIAGSSFIHPELYHNYMDILDTPTNIKIDKSLEKSTGQFNPGSGQITVNAINSEDAKSILLHEIGHKIQQIEGQGKGGSPKAIPTAEDLKPIWEDILQKYSSQYPQEEAAKYSAQWIYRNLYGEALSRVVQERMNMTDLERLALHPKESFTNIMVPVKDLIVRKQ